MPESVLHILERFVRRGTRLRDRPRVASCHGGKRRRLGLSTRFELGYTCVPQQEERGGGPLACLVLVSSLKLRKERRRKGLGALLTVALPRGTHV